MDTLQEHWETLRAAEERFLNERDRRYAEVNAEREKALIIKEKAEDKALNLAREIQSYKDEKANNLRDQITEERGSLANKGDLSALKREIDAMIAPLTAYVVGAGAQAKQSSTSIANIVAAASVVYAVVATIAAGAAFVGRPQPTQPQLIYAPTPQIAPAPQQAPQVLPQH